VNVDIILYILGIKISYLTTDGYIIDNENLEYENITNPICKNTLKSFKNLRIELSGNINI